MKRILTLLVCLLFSTFLRGQYSLQIEYNQIFNTDFPLIRTGLLQVNSNQSIFVDLMKSKRPIKENSDTNISYLDNLSDHERYTEIKEGEKINLQVGGNYDQYYMYDQSKKTFLFTGELGKEQFLISDNFNLQWEITNETKTISNYKVYKASTNFRGRNWDAWFAPELAYNFGPWKLHGLPGLILEAYDDSHRYHFVAIKIKNDKNLPMEPNTHFLKKIDFKNFILGNFEIIENSVNIIERDYEVIRHNVKRNSKELIYEWEEQPKKQ
ncbi:GLPGLI family protein [Paenimyroides aestuarii]|uniref:GLPGLI family protein n=1 Tax=Paenimyroides aestuarii TaxID=2968490 RepID=A0ABY5NR70_9FLAO|nr:GLPGLI family protein [Paenimyroides aestuarii]UUV20989.1 GLPGLI family protein [Paenimyroides aestuarii]